MPVPSTSPMQKTSVQYVSSRKKSGVAPPEDATPVKPTDLGPLDRCYDDCNLLRQDRCGEDRKLLLN